MPILRTIDDVVHWVDGAIQRFGDPARPVALNFAKYVNRSGAQKLSEDDIVATYQDGWMKLRLGPACMVDLPIRNPGASAVEVQREGLPVYELKKISDFIWALSPSFNHPALIHTFVCFYQVPSPAPWE
jgi:hypothetical protein